MILRRALPALLVFAALVGLAGTALLVGGSDAHERVIRAADTMETQLLREAVLGPAATPEQLDLLGARFDLALADGLVSAEDDPQSRASLLSLGNLAHRWRSADATARPPLIDSFTSQTAGLRERLEGERSSGSAVRNRALLILTILIALFVAAAATIVAFRAWRRYSTQAAAERHLLLEDRRHRGEQEEFARALQGARSEREAQRMLKRQLERTLEDGSATVLNRNNSDNRLEAVTALPSGSPLAEIMPEAEPDDCLAVRFGQPNSRASGESPLLSCELCGALDGSVTCVPSLVGGEVIGSVLVETPEPLDDGGQRRLSVAVGYAAPVLASMRNLKLAETRAATDALTGLANRRSAEETLNRMIAMAGRTATPCAVVSFDLDHFKNVNDVYGHDKGDALLAAVADAATSSVRASDFVSRFGGEEFLVVLPDTELEGAMLVCENLRSAIAELRIPGVGQSPSASFGVAVFPTDGEEIEALLRGADRALYAAKSAGRNCVKALRVLDDPVSTIGVHARRETAPPRAARAGEVPVDGSDA